MRRESNPPTYTERPHVAPEMKGQYQGDNRWECPSGGEVFDTDVGVCPAHGVPVRLVGRFADPVAGEAAVSGSPNPSPPAEQEPVRGRQRGPEGAESQTIEDLSARTDYEVDFTSGGKKDHTMYGDKRHPADDPRST